MRHRAACDDGIDRISQVMNRRSPPRLAQVGVEIVNAPAITNAAGPVDHNRFRGRSGVYLHRDSPRVVCCGWNAAIAKLVEMRADRPDIHREILVDKSTTRTATIEFLDYTGSAEDSP
jgi:hypothetical protein